MLRKRLPFGHRLLILNYSDTQHFANYYGEPPENIRTLLNPRDLRVFMGMTYQAATLVTKHTPHLVDVAQVYPFSLPRMGAKHAEKVVELFGTFKSLGQSVRLIFATAHANGEQEKEKVALIKNIAKAKGLADDEVVFTHESLPETAHAGIDRDTIRALFQACNLFAFPTESEAGSLVLLEAAQSGCLLVLNESLPCLLDYVRREDALWVPWGSLKEQGKSVPLQPLAERILTKLEDTAMRSKRIALRNSSLEMYGERLVKVLDS